VERSAIAEHVIQNVVQVRIVGPSAEQIDGHLVRLDQVAAFGAMNCHLGQWVE
jgi:hypothetical protein